MLSNCPGKFTLEKTVEGLLFSIADLLSQSFDGDAATLVISDLQVLLPSDLPCALIWKQVTNLLIVDLRVTDPDCDGLLKLVAGESIELRDGTRHETTILENSRAARHGVGLSSTSLSVAKDGAIVALNN